MSEVNEVERQLRYYRYDVAHGAAMLADIERRRLELVQRIAEAPEKILELEKQLLLLLCLEQQKHAIPTTDNQ